MITKLIITTVLVAVGQYVANSFVLKATPESSSGFVLVDTSSPWGVDDFASAMTIALLVTFGAGIVGKFFGKKG